MPDRAHVQRIYLRDLADWARREAVAPAAAVAGLAGVAARAEGWPSTGLDAIERLNPSWSATTLPPPPAELDLDPSLLGPAYEAVLDAGVRRARGAYFTPPLVARRLLDAVLDGGVEAGPVVDPAVGGGAFLLAAAARMVDSLPSCGAAGRSSPATIVRHRLHGTDIDPVAVAVARLGLGWWAWRAQGRGPDAWPPDAGRHVVVGDALLDDACWPEADPSRPGVVVGNPPFLGQLSRRTARPPALSARLVERLGPAARGYVDGAALFLLAACRRGLPGCRIGLILPESVLVTAHADAVRREVLGRGRLLGLWLGGADVFGAGVHVCAPIIELGHAEEDDRPYRLDRPGRPGWPARRPIRAWGGAAVEPCGDLPVDTADLRGALTWGALTAPLRGVPPFRLPAPSPRSPRSPRSSGGGTGRLGDLARATAGFRDQFYGLRPHVVEGPAVADGRDRRSAPLITSGLIDPARCDWGRRDARFAGRRFRRPVVDLDALAAADERLAAWVGDRLRPKVLVATQAKVLEAAADPDGRLVPSVPVVAVEPADPADVWRILAVLCSPVATAWALGHYGGAGLSTQSIKLSARQVLAVPTPADGDRWAEAAASCRSAADASAAPELSDTERSDRYRDHLRRAAVQSCWAYGVASDEVRTLVRWWERRVRWEDPEILRPSP